jgi:hypothetical protein
MPVSSWVNSVEFIDAVISGSNNSAIYNLSMGQNYNYCVPFFTTYGDSTYWDSRLTDVTFSGTTNSGTIKFERSNNRATSNYIKCYVVEFNPTQVRVQQGSFSLSGTTTTTVTLPTTVSGTDRVAMTFGWQTDNTYRYPTCTAVRGKVLSTASIDFYRYASVSNCSGHWFLFEDLGNNFRTYHLAGNYQENSQTLNINGTSTVDPLRTFILGSYAANDTDEGYSTYWANRISLYSVGTVKSDRSGASGTWIYWAAQVVEIQDKTKVYVPMDHALVGWTSPTTYARNVGGLSERVPFVCNLQTSSIVTAMMQGSARMDMAGNTTSMNSLMVASELTSSGTITHTKAGTTYATYPSYTVAVDWAGIPISIETNLTPIPEGNGSNQSFVKSVENFRFTLSGNLGVYKLTKGQTVSNCAVFSSNRSVSSDTINTIIVSVCIMEPGLIYMQHFSDTEQSIIDISVVEFHPTQVKVQQKIVSVTTDSTINVPITEISSVNKAFILSSVNTSYDAYTQGVKYSFFRVAFTSTTNVQLYRRAVGYTVVCMIFIVEDLKNNFVTLHNSRTFNSPNTDFFYDGTYNWGSHNSFPIVTYTTDENEGSPAYAAIRGLYYTPFKPVHCFKNSAGYNTDWASTIVKFIDERKHTQSIKVDLVTTNAVVNGYYDIDLRNTENITAYNVCQYSTAGCNTHSTTGVSEAFNTIRITNYNTGEYEISKGGVSFTSYFGGHIINWIGFHYQDSNNITGTRTKSFINSIQRDSFSTIGGSIQVWLRHNQDIKKCVPFIVNSAAASDGNLSRLYKVVYRYENPDCFRINFGSNNTGTRKILPYIVEFNQNIKVQYGSGYSTGSTKTFTIERVNLDRAFLQFFSHGDSWFTQFRYYNVCGYFSSSTEITFFKSDVSYPMYISWYVVECPDWGADSYWSVYHNYSSGLGNGTPVYAWLPVQPAVDRTIFLSSYSTEENEGSPAYGAVRVYNRQDHGVQVEKNSAGYNISALNVEAIEFSPSIGLNVYSNFYTMAPGVSTSDISLKLNAYDKFHIQRSMVIQALSQNITRVDTHTVAGSQEGFHYMEFKDTTGSGYSNTITVSRNSSSYNAQGYYYAIQFPKFNKYYFSGYVRELGIPVSRRVAAYKSSSGEIVDTTTSNSGTGYFYLETTDYEAHHIVALDDDYGDSYNHLIYGKIYPTVISGAFAWVADYPTVSGIGEFIDL